MKTILGGVLLQAVKVIAVINSSNIFFIDNILS
jgi:hypothetical protein